MVNAMQSANVSSPLFLRVQLWRLVVMSLLTLGVYELYWIFRNWKYVQLRDKLDIRPFWRALFGIFWVHGLLKRMALDSDTNAVEPAEFNAGTLATAWVAMRVGSNVVSRFPGTVATYIAILMPSFLALVPVQRYVNAVEEKRDPAGEWDSWSVTQIVMGLLGLGLWALILLGTLIELSEALAT